MLANIFSIFLQIPLADTTIESAIYIVQRDLNSNDSLDARVSYQPDNIGDLSNHTFNIEGVSNHGFSEDQCQAHDLGSANRIDTSTRMH